MEDFKRELKRKCDLEFVKLKNKHSPKPSKKGTIQSVHNNVQSFKKLTEETNKMVVMKANDLMSKVDITKENATKVAQDIMRDYLTQIKKNSGF